jgi:rhodanese-related sulfurtransferase
MRQISVEEVRDALDSAAPPQLVDCRERWEWDLGHLPGALHAPLGELADHVDRLDPVRPVVVYCHAGVRSVHGALLLEELGFRADSMRGGTEAWSLRVDPSLPRY